MGIKITHNHNKNFVCVCQKPKSFKGGKITQAEKIIAIYRDT